MNRMEGAGRLSISRPARLVLKLIMAVNGLLCTVRNGHLLGRCGRPRIYVFNHSSAFETLFLASYLVNERGGLKVSFVIDWMFRFIPVIGWMMSRIDPIYVHTKKARYRILERMRKRRPGIPAVEQALDRLASGYSIALFPEGRVNRDPRFLLRARRGVGVIALSSGAPVQPIGIDFPDRAKRGKIPRFGSFILNVGREMEFQDEAKEYARGSGNGINNCADSAKLLARAVTHRIMSELASLCGKSYTFEDPGLEKGSVGEIYT